MEKPIVLVIMDGVGKGDGGSGDAVKNANTPTLDHLLATCPHTYLKAHGTAVGLPTDDDMGNSEVGHNALAAARFIPRAQSSSASPLSPARCMSPLPGRSCCPTPFLAMPCISWACCPMATFIPTSLT